MIVTKKHVEDAKKVYVGPQVAYLTRTRYLKSPGKGAFRHAAPYEGESNPDKDPFLQSGWPGFWKKVRSKPSLLVEAAFSATGGISKEVYDNALTMLKIRRPIVPSRSRIVKLKKKADGTPLADILMPKKGGGVALLTVVCKGATNKAGNFTPELQEGAAIEVNKRTAVESGNEYYHLRVPYLTHITKGGHFASNYIDAREVADVVESQYQNMSLCGRWAFNEVATTQIRQHLKLDHLHKKLFSIYTDVEDKHSMLIFRGTSVTSPSDWFTNLGTFSGLETTQYRAAAQVAEFAGQHFPNLLIAGHSKGAGLAQYAAAHTGIRAVCFNAVGLPEGIIPPAPPQGGYPIDHFAARYDIFSNVAGVYSKAMGFTMPMPDFAGIIPKFSVKEQHNLASEDRNFLLPTTVPRNRFITLHSMEVLSHALKKKPHLIARPFERDHTLVKTPVIDVHARLAEEESLPCPGTPPKTVSSPSISRV